MSRNRRVSVLVLPVGEADVGDGGSGGQGLLVSSEDKGPSTGQPAGASALGGGHRRAPNVHRTHPSYRHVPVAQTGLSVAAGGGQSYAVVSKVSP